MKLKMRLTPEEIKEYNSYKDRIITARTRQEVSMYSEMAKKILNVGRSRYIKELERQPAKLRIKSVGIPKSTQSAGLQTGNWVMAGPELASVMIGTPKAKPLRYKKVTTK